MTTNVKNSSKQSTGDLNVDKDLKTSTGNFVVSIFFFSFFFLGEGGEEFVWTSAITWRLSKHLHLNPLLWNGWTKFGWDGSSVVPLHNYVWQPSHSFKMVTVTKNRNFFNCPLLLYYKSQSAQILTAATCHMALSSLTFIPGFSVKFFFQPIMQIRHILMNDRISLQLYGIE